MCYRNGISKLRHPCEVCHDEAEQLPAPTEHPSEKGTLYGSKELPHSGPSEEGPEAEHSCKRGITVQLLGHCYGFHG